MVERKEVKENVDTNRFKKEVQQGEDLFQKGKTREALNMFEAVLEKDPDNIAALNDKGVALNKLGRFQEAIQTFLEILSKENMNSNAVFNLISNYLVVGKWKEAEKIFQQYDHCLVEQDVAMIRKDLERIKSKNSNTADSNSPKEATTFAYEQTHARINDILDRNFFFVTGIPKSGTTWMQYLLNGHPDIWCSGEDNYNILMDFLEKKGRYYNNEITAANSTIGGREYVLLNQENLSHLLVTAVALLLCNKASDSAVKYIGSKNSLVMKTTEAYAYLFPKAKFIHIIRDGRDVSVSGWFNNLRANERETKQRWPDFRSYVEYCAHAWAFDVRKMRLFGQTYPDRYFEVRYEDLHKIPKVVIERILTFLGVDSSLAMVNLCREAGAFEKHSGGRQRGQEDQKAFFRKGIVGDWRNHFGQDLLDIFMQSAGDLLQDLGYE